MSVTSPADTALYRATIAQLDRQAAGTLLGPLRQRSADWFRTHGFPLPKEEAWRFNPLDRITALPFAPATDPSSVRVAGDEPLPPGVEVSTIAELAAREPEAVLPHLGIAEDPATAFSALNAALFEGGLAVRVVPGTVLDRPLQILVASSAHDQPRVDTPRVLVLAGRDCDVELIETHDSSGSAPFLSNSVVQVRLDEGARVTHTRVALGSEHSRRVGLLDVRQARDSRYTSRVVTLGGAFSRLDLRIRFDGEGAEANLQGVFLASGDERVDHHTIVDHIVPRCTSQQSYRGIVDDHARAVFDGIVHVRAGAQQTSAHQQSRNLLLSDQAVVNTKPHLEIDADDVSCSHGASVGQIDEEQVFYLRSRGLEESAARAMLAEAFVREMVDDIGFEPLRAQVHEWVRRRLPGAARRSP